MSALDPMGRPGATNRLAGSDHPHGSAGARDTTIDGRVAPRRAHPLTPLLRGWRLLAGIVAIVTAQNLGALLDEFTWDRALIALAAMAGLLVLGIGASAIIWWRTTFEVDEDGVTLRSGLLTLARRTAPRDRIESVSIERPVVARMLGLATVRVEVAGGTDSHLDISYVASAEAERLRLEILRSVTEGEGVAADGDEAVSAATDPARATGKPEHEKDSAAGDADPGADTHIVRRFALDGVVDGAPIAQIPTARLIRSMLRDLRFLITIAISLIWVTVVLVLGALSEDGIGLGSLIAAAPILLVGPRAMLETIENGWGFVSRLTDRGLRMRRGLFSTRTDSIGPGRLQEMTLRQPLLWRGPGWVAATATVAGIGEEADEDGANVVLPVGTQDELRRTLDCLLTPLGTEDDLVAALDLLARPARSIAGDRPAHRLQWIGRRTRAVVVLPGAVALRSGILARRVRLVPRDRIQGLWTSQGPLGRALGAADLSIGIGGASVEASGLPLARCLALQDQLTADAVYGRRMDDQQSWARPRGLETSGAAA